MNKEEVEIIVSDPRHVLFWQVDVDCLAALHLIGIHFNLNDRIPIFKVYREVEKMLGTMKEPEVIARLLDAQSHLDRLVKYRHQGFEPPFTGEKYT